MQFLFHQQMNIISAIVLLFFLLYSIIVLDKNSKINNIYIISLSLNLVIIALDVAFNFFINRMDSISIFVPRIIGGLIFMLSPFLPYLFLQFVCSYFTTPYKIKRLTKMFFIVLFILNFAVAIFSFKSRTFIEINIAENLLPFLLGTVFLTYSIFIVFTSKRKLIYFEYIYITTMSIIVFALVLIQLFLIKTMFIWSGSTFTLILMFIVIQQRELYRDSLTGARNRLVLKKCIDAYNKKTGGNLSVVMIDLDYFKNINDSYGHSEGDYVLKTFVKVMQKVYSENGIVIRMGGDEFLVLIYKISTIEVNELIKKMSKLIDRYNNKGVKPYRIKYSCASGTYNNDISIEQFIHEIDLKMYQNKNGRKGKTWSVEKL